MGGAEEKSEALQPPRRKKGGDAGKGTGSGTTALREVKTSMAKTDPGEKKEMKGSTEVPE